MILSMCSTRLMSSAESNKAGKAKSKANEAKAHVRACVLSAS
jgi:hypothetical protein